MTGGSRQVQVTEDLPLWSRLMEHPKTGRGRSLKATVTQEKVRQVQGTKLA